ncbi:hypothetical protein ACQ4PT_021857 [Festuca glaucescens]
MVVDVPVTVAGGQPTPGEVAAMVSATMPGKRKRAVYQPQAEVGAAPAVAAAAVTPAPPKTGRSKTKSAGPRGNPPSKAKAANRVGLAPPAAQGRRPSSVHSAASASSRQRRPQRVRLLIWQDMTPMLSCPDHARLPERSSMGKFNSSAEAVVPIQMFQVTQKFPSISVYRAFSVPSSVDIDGLMKCQMAVASFGAVGKHTDVPGLQLLGVLDDMFT